MLQLFCILIATLSHIDYLFLIRNHQTHDTITSAQDVPKKLALHVLAGGHILSFR